MEKVSKDQKLQNYLNEKQVAKRLGVSVKLLRKHLAQRCVTRLFLRSHVFDTRRTFLDQPSPVSIAIIRQKPRVRPTVAAVSCDAVDMERSCHGRLR